MSIDISDGSLRSDQIAIPTDHPIRALIQDVRDNGNPTMWCLAKLDANLQLEAVGSGSGKVDELAAKLTADTAYYGLVRTTETIDSTVNVKFCFLSYLGESVGPVKKGKITTFKGTLESVFHPYHVELLNCTSPSEVTMAAIEERLGEMFGGVKDAVKDEGVMRMPGGRTVKVVTKQSVAARTGVAEKQQVVLPPELSDAILDVRSDATATDWCLCGFDAKFEKLQMVGSGSGGLAELRANLSESNAHYGFARFKEVIDKSNVLTADKSSFKFVYITFIGDGVGPMKKGKITTLKGTITEAFEPFHVELLNATSPSEVTDEAVVDLIKSMTGEMRDVKEGDGHMRIGQKVVHVAQHKTTNATVDKIAAGRVGAATDTGFESARQSTQVSDAVKKAIADVRSNNDPSTWCVLGYDTGKQPSLVVVGSGTGDAESMHPLLAADSLLYALVRVTQQVDRSTTVKFALVSWVGEHVPPMRKAKLSTLRGAATEVLGSVHAEIMNADAVAAVSHQIIMEKLEGK